MKGTIRKRGAKPNEWSLIYDAPKHADGRRNQKWISFHGTKRQAEAELARLIHQAETGQYIEGSRLTTGEFLEYWLEKIVRPRRAVGTVYIYERSLSRHIIPALGKVPLSRLSAHHLEIYYSDKRATLSSATVALHHRILAAALRRAVQWEMIPKNPAALPDPPQQESPEREPLTAEQTVQLLNAAWGQPLYGPIVLATCFGLRIGEVTALRWVDVDLETGVVKIRQSLSEIGSELVFHPPKSKQSRRALPLPEQAWAWLIVHQQEQERVRLACGADWQETGLVFPLEDGRIWRPTTMRRRYYRLLASVGLPRVHFHDLRHSHITHLLARGIPLHVVSRRAGHANTSITANVYGHVLPGMQEAASDVADELLQDSLSRRARNGTIDPSVSRLLVAPPETP